MKSLCVLLVVVLVVFSALHTGAEGRGTSTRRRGYGGYVDEITTEYTYGGGDEMADPYEEEDEGEGGIYGGADDIYDELYGEGEDEGEGGYLYEDCENFDFYGDDEGEGEDGCGEDVYEEDEEDIGYGGGYGGGDAGGGYGGGDAGGGYGGGDAGGGYGGGDAGGGYGGGYEDDDTWTFGCDLYYGEYTTNYDDVPVYTGDGDVDGYVDGNADDGTDVYDDVEDVYEGNDDGTDVYDDVEDVYENDDVTDVYENDDATVGYNNNDGDSSASTLGSFLFF